MMGLLNSRKSGRGNGFTLLEMVIAMTMFMVISGAVFLLLRDAQVKVMGEQNIVPVLQESRVAMDVLVKDIHRAGFPSPFEFPASLVPSDPSTATLVNQNLFSVGFVGVPNQTCVVTGTCTVPNGFDLVMESDPDPADNVGVQWIEYQLVRQAGQTKSTLMRSQVAKQAAVGLAGTAPNWMPILENVLNDPNNPADAIFSYPQCNTGACPTAKMLQQVQINLRIQSYKPNLQTNQYSQISVVEVAQRMNPTP